MAKNDIILNIGFKIDKSAIDTRALTDTIAKRLRNVSINKIKVSKKAINDAFKDFTLNVNKIKISQNAISRLKAQLQKELSSLKVNVSPGPSRGAAASGGAQAAAPTFSPGQALIDGRSLANAKAYRSLVEEIATRVTPNALRAQQRYNRAIGQGGVSFKELGARVAAITQRFGEYALAIRAVGAIQQTIGTGFEGVLNFDSAIQDLSKVQLAADDIGSAFGAVTEAALSTGRGIDEVSTAINEFVRQGKSLGEAAKFAEESLKLANISALNAADSARLATAAQQVFGVTSADLSEKLGTIAVFADQSATSVTEIGTAFLRSASSAEAAGISFEQFTGLLAATLEQTRLGAANVGTAFKTLLARTLKFRKEIVTLANGYAEAAGNQDAIIQSSDNVLQIFEKISKIFPTLNAQQKNQIALQVAGVRQANVFVGTLNNLEKAQSLYNSSVDGASALNEKNSAELEKLSVRAKNLVTSFQALSASLAGLSSGEQDGAVGFIGSLVDSFTGTIAAFTEVTTSLDDVEAGFVNIGDTVKTALFGALVGVVQVLKGPLLQGVSDFFSTSSRGARALTESLINQERQFLNSAKAASASGRQIAGVFSQSASSIVKSNQATQQSLAQQIPLLGSLSRLVSGRANAQNTIINNNDRIIAQLRSQNSLQQDSLLTLLKISNAASRSRQASNQNSFGRSAGRGAAVFALSDTINQSLDSLAKDLEESGSLVSAEIARSSGEFVQNATLLGSIFGRSGVAVALFTTSVSFAAKRISEAFDEAESRITQAFIDREFSAINTVPIVRELESLRNQLGGVANAFSEITEAERIRVEITREINQASDDYLDSLRKQSLEADGFSSSAAEAISSIRRFGEQISFVETGGGRRNFSDSPEGFASLIGELGANGESFSVVTEELKESRNLLRQAQDDLLRIENAANAAFAPFDDLTDGLKQIVENTEGAGFQFEALRDRVQFGDILDGADFGALDLAARGATVTDDAIRSAAQGLIEYVENQRSSLGVQKEQNVAFTAAEEAQKRVNKELERANKLGIEIAEQERLLQTILSGIADQRDSVIQKQDESFKKTSDELDLREKIIALENAEASTLEQKLARELSINQLKRERELLNTKEIEGLRETLRLAKERGSEEQRTAAFTALSQAEDNARSNARSLAQRDTSLSSSSIVDEEVKNTFERISEIIKNVNDRVEQSEKDRVSAIEEVIEANNQIISAEQSLASARASLSDANSNVVSALREAADAQARYAVDIRSAQRAALESTGAQQSLASAFDFAAGNIEQVTNRLNGTIASEQLLAQIRAESAADLLQRVTQLASTISGFAVSFFTASDAQRSQLQQAQGIAQGIASGDIAASSVPEELRGAVAQFSDIIPGLREQLEGFGAEQTGLSGQLEQLRQVSLQLAKDSVSREQLTATQDALAAAQSQAAQAEEAVRTAKDQLAVANVQKQIAISNLAEATAARNIALADANTLEFYTDRALDKLDGINDGTRDTISTLQSVGRDIVSALRSLSIVGRESVANAAGGTLSGAEINGVIGAARREKRLMPAGSKLMLANTSETVLTRRQAGSLGLRPRRQSNAVNGNADGTAMTSLMESLIGEIRALRSEVSSGGVHQVNLQVDTQRNINVRGIEGLSQRLERELAGKFASGGEMEALSGLIIDIVTRMNEVGLSDGLGR